MEIRERARRFSAGVIAREILVDVACVLARHHIDIMPLKGVVLRELVYDDPAERDLTDVDVAVRSGEFRSAVAALVGAGYQVELEQPSLFELSLRRGDSPMCVDLHQRLSSSRRHRLTVDAMFARGRPDSELFGVRVVLPDDYDCFAHLLAHATIHYANDGAWHRPQDLGRFARARKLNSVRCARHLEACGLGRFARVALASLRLDDDVLRGFADEVLRNLRPDPVADAVAGLARAVYEREKRPELLRRAVGVLLNPTFGDALLALTDAASWRFLRGVSAVSHRRPPKG